MTLADLQARAKAGDAGAQVELAAQLDEQGRHDDAINCLAVAGRAGDAKALTILGLRLVTGRNAPFLPKDGAGLLGDAAARGGADAAGHLAVLAALGFYVEQNWQAALECLLRSAELGSASAQEQLRILAGEDVRQPPPGPPFWRRLREAIDLGAWLKSSTPSRSLSDSPVMLVFDGFVPPEVCDWMARQSRARLSRAHVYGEADGGALVNRGRTNTTANFALVETNLLNVLIQAKIGAATGTPLARMEAFNIMHYDVGEEFRDHFDFLDPSVPAYGQEIARMGQRVGTFLVYLNDDYEGGETAFPKLGVAHRGAKGSGFYFRSCDAAGKPDVRSTHAGRPTTSGEKWVLSQFIRDRAIVGAAG
jgi:hypothetical protein